MADVLVERFKTSHTSQELNLKENEHNTLIIFNSGIKDAKYNLKATLNKGARLDIYNVVISNLNTELNEEINLCDVDATCNILNVLLVGDNATLNSNIMINHLSKLTNSDFSNYAIAQGEATMVLNNNAKIIKGASKSVVHQKAKGLTLSKTAKIKAMPNLFIDEYDVIANHAASIGSINKEDLFYLMSRGLEEKEASKLIVLGFVQPLLDKIDNEELKEEISKEFAKNL